MAQQNTFDVVSQVDMAAVKNAVNPAMKEVTQRFDFKGTNSTIELNEKEHTLQLATASEFTLKSLNDVLQQKLVRRNVSLKASAQPSGEDSDLYRALRLLGTPRGGKGGFFLRAEKMHELFTAVGPEGPWADRFGGVDLHARSHGQAFIQVLKTRVEEQGLYLFDEPEAALSFTSCLGLIALLARIPSEGSQAIVATHSPLIAATPDATLIEVGEWGMRRVAYKDVELVRSWRDFLERPERFVKYLGTD